MVKANRTTKLPKPTQPPQERPRINPQATFETGRPRKPQVRKIKYVGPEQDRHQTPGLDIFWRWFPTQTYLKKDATKESNSPETIRKIIYRLKGEL